MRFKQTKEQQSRWQYDISAFIVERLADGSVIIDNSLPGYAEAVGREPKQKTTPSRAARAAMATRHAPKLPGKPSPPIPFDQWPDDLKKLAEKRQPDDKGIGDVIARELGWVGAAYKTVRRLLAMPCRCADRQAWLNAVYPLP